MKTIKIQLFILVVMLCITTSFAQTIRRVNNTGIPLGANMYASLQEAHNAASTGDIVYVEGSGTAYGDLTLTKKLTIIGPGYLLGENYNTISDLRAVDLGTVNFNAGSEGSSVVGCSNFSINIKVSNITISRNFNVDVLLNNGSISITGIVITKNYDIAVDVISSANVNMVITNNYIGVDLNSTNVSGTFVNNIVVGYSYLANFNVSNNILLSSYAPSLTNCTLSNNIDARALTNSSAFGTTNGNKANIDKATLFVGPTGNSSDGQWKLKTGSVAIGAGLNGMDCGMFGGSDPYELSGVSSLDYPVITKLTTSGTGSSTTPLSVTISTKSN